MLIGYARVSTDDQDTAAQVAALKAAGCERIFREKASGGRWERPQFLRLLNQLRAGDVVVVWKLDRLSRSLRDVLTIMEQLGEVGAGFRSLTEAIDTTTPAGRMMMQMVGVISREKAQIGAFLSLEPPTSPMRREAASAGFYESPWGKHPRIQLLTIEALLGGKSIDYPQDTDVTFKKAQRVRYDPLEKQKDLPMMDERPGSD